MGEILRFPPQRYTDALVARLRRLFDEAAAEWRARGGTARYHEIRDDADRTISALTVAGLPPDAALRRTLQNQGRGA